jgi:hypothetical protein
LCSSCFSSLCSSFFLSSASFLRTYFSRSSRLLAVSGSFFYS